MLRRRAVKPGFIDNKNIFCYDNAETKKRSAMVEAKVTLIKEMQFQGTASSGHSLTMDADDVSGGKNTGFRPMELLLVGFGGCSGMDVISILRKKRQQISGIEITVKGEKTDSYPKIYKTVHIEYVVTGRAIQADAVERAINLSLEKYCSVGATLAKAGTITHSYRIIEA